jgi:hypothetical protein
MRAFFLPIIGWSLAEYRNSKYASQNIFIPYYRRPKGGWIRA